MQGNTDVGMRWGRGGDIGDMRHRGKEIEEHAFRDLENRAFCLKWQLLYSQRHHFLSPPFLSTSDPITVPSSPLLLSSSIIIQHE
jgi:hypothetical protein